MDWLAIAAICMAGVAVLLLGLRVGGALTAAIPGLPDAGPATTWALPVIRLLCDGLATGAVGMRVDQFTVVDGTLIPTRLRETRGTSVHMPRCGAGRCAA
ncbi:hypothetical protein [Micromonospora profundi]|uniref:hypothetical protein n=1 Tax=Micromonospora profundi TaxID=1420889 RepID=UPI003651F48F